MPCCICVLYKTKQKTITEAAHVGKRGLSQKCNDLETIPLCQDHHREGPHAHHKLGKRFFDLHGIDKDELVLKLNTDYKL
jgi:hypothetical protein